MMIFCLSCFLFNYIKINCKFKIVLFSKWNFLFMGAIRLQLCMYVNVQEFDGPNSIPTTDKKESFSIRIMSAKIIDLQQGWSNQKIASQITNKKLCNKQESFCWFSCCDFLFKRNRFLPFDHWIWSFPLVICFRTWENPCPRFMCIPSIRNENRFAV